MWSQGASLCSLLLRSSICAHEKSKFNLDCKLSEAWENCALIKPMDHSQINNCPSNKETPNSLSNYTKSLIVLSASWYFSSPELGMRCYPFPSQVLSKPQCQICPSTLIRHSFYPKGRKGIAANKGISVLREKKIYGDWNSEINV